MAHYALLNDTNYVERVFVGADEWVHPGNWEEFYSNMFQQRVVRTSYNTKDGVHIKDDKPFRGNYAAKGMKYDEQRDAFIWDQPFPSWVLRRYTWVPPVDLPADAGPLKQYQWNETDRNWDLIT